MGYRNIVSAGSRHCLITGNKTLLLESPGDVTLEYILMVLYPNLPTLYKDQLTLFARKKELSFISFLFSLSTYTPNIFSLLSDTLVHKMKDSSYH